MNHKKEWLVLGISFVMLSIVYGFKITKMLETLLQWTFAATGFKLLIDYGYLDVRRLWKGNTKEVSYSIETGEAKANG